MGTASKRALCTDTRAYAKGSIYIKDGHKHAICMQCGADYNVSWQFFGWYTCPVCWGKNRKEKQKDGKNRYQNNQKEQRG